jgi:hypothetical protein
MLTAKQLEEFELNGFLKGDVMLSEAEVDRLREELELVLEGKSTKKPVSSTNLLDGIQPADLISAWVALDDAVIENEKKSTSVLLTEIDYNLFYEVIWIYSQLISLPVDSSFQSLIVS